MSRQFDPTYSGADPRTSRPLVFKTEALLILVVLVYALAWYFGKTTNVRIANDW